MIYEICKKLIAQYKKKKQKAKLEDMANKLDIYLAADRLTEEQYEELMGMIG